MCGIAGIFHAETPKPVDPSRVERMCDALAHRGPDGSGVWTDQGVGLGTVPVGLARKDRADAAFAIQEDGLGHLALTGQLKRQLEFHVAVERQGFVHVDEAARIGHEPGYQDNRLGRGWVAKDE